MAANFTKTTLLPSVIVFLLATTSIIILFGSTRTAGQEDMSSMEVFLDKVEDILANNLNDILRIGVAMLDSEGVPSRSVVHGGLTPVGSSAGRSGPNSRADRLVTGTSGISAKHADDDVHKELKKFRAKITKDVGEFCGKFDEAVQKMEISQSEALKGGVNKNQASSTVRSDPNPKMAGSVSGRNKGNNN